MSKELQPWQLALSLGNVIRHAASRIMREPDPHATRIDIYHMVDVEDAAVKLLGRPHRVQVRIRITCRSLLFENTKVGSK